jgi:hypothetical protein
MRICSVPDGSFRSPARISRCRITAGKTLTKIAGNVQSRVDLAKANAAAPVKFAPTEILRNSIPHGLTGNASAALDDELPGSRRFPPRHHV